MVNNKFRSNFIRTGLELSFILKIGNKKKIRPRIKFSISFMCGTKAEIGIINF